MKDKTIYTEDSIQSVDPRTFTRMKPNVYCGSTEYSTQLGIEVISNSIDEVQLGHGERIDITSNKTSMSVRDYGQGFPINSMRDDGKTILEASFSVLNTSGKYSESGVYQGTSLGNFGIGAKLQTYLSSLSEVTSWKDGKYEKVIFKDGLFDSRETGDSNEPNGTLVKWYPDKQFFDHIEWDETVMKNYIRTLTALIPGLLINYNNKTYQSKNGIDDLIDNVTKDNEFIKNRFKVNSTKDKYKIDLTLTYTTNYSSNIIAYVNTGLTDTGPHISGIKSLFTREFNKFFRDKGWLKDKDENLSGDDLSEGMVLVFNITTSGVKYDAQVKSRVVSLEMTPFTSIIQEELLIWMQNNEKDVKSIADKAIRARKAREAAQAARDASRRNKDAKKKRVINPDKLKEAELLGEDSTLLCVEGLSAGASMTNSRDAKHYGVLMLRGKPLNLFTNSEDKATKNEEIQLLINALGITPGDYKASDLRYGRVAICSDSDSDGYHIGLLLAVALQKLCPEFIKEGRLCWLRSPLWIVKQGKTEEYYYTDEEVNAVRNDRKGALFQRNKGLGSLSPAQARCSMFSPEYQRMDVLTPTEEAIKLLEDLMGKDNKKRKDYIFENVDFTEVME